MKKITNKLFIIPLAIMLFGMTACEEDEENINTDIAVPVSVKPVSRKSMKEIFSTTGTVMASKETKLNTEVAGKYYLLKNPKTGRVFKLGDVIQKGQALVKLEDKEYENNLKIKSLELDLDISKREHEKQKSLYEKGGVTLRELKNAEITYVNSQYAYDNAIIQLAKMTVKAPFTGVIVALPKFTQGTQMATNTEVMTIMDYRKLYMEINLPEKNMQTVKVGQEIMIMNYNLPEDTLTGTITQLSPAIDTESRTFSGKLIISNPNLLLRPGMFVKGDIILREKENIIVIPKNIIISSQRGKKVFVVEKGASIQRIISTGIESDDEIEVLGGLKNDERLVVDGFETLRNNSKVKVLQ